MALQKCSSGDGAAGNIDVQRNPTLTSTSFKRKSGGRRGGIVAAPTNCFQFHVYGYLFPTRMNVVSPPGAHRTLYNTLPITFALISSHLGLSDALAYWNDKLLSSIITGVGS
jgi:hypothetical protein